MVYMTLEAQIDHGRITVKEPDKLPLLGQGLLVVAVQDSPASQPTQAHRERVRLPLVQGEGGQCVNPTAEVLDASLWD